MRVAGIMSGTSLDGIDVAIVDIHQGGTDGQQIHTVAHTTVPYPEETRQRILAVSNTNCHTRDISRLNFELPRLYADAVQSLNIPVELVGCHGQTVYHEGDTDTPNTLQLGEAAVLAERLGVPVISNFRCRDMAAGGKGAPLVPFVDHLLFAHGNHRRVALNIGGIANITVLHPGEPVIAFDTGPGNMIVDQLVELYSKGTQRFDRDGAIAATGSIDRELLDKLLDDSYFEAPPPKTAGREQYGLAFLEMLGDPSPNLIATVTAFSAAAIALGINRFAHGTTELIAAGGGVHNSQLMAQLAAFLPGVHIRTTAEFGIDPDAKEAIAFAVLAYQTWHKRPGNLPSATGAKRAVILGDLTL